MALNTSKRLLIFIPSLAIFGVALWWLKERLSRDQFFWLLIILALIATIRERLFSGGPATGDNKANR